MDKKYLCLAILAVCAIAGCVAWIGFYDNSKKELAGDVAAFDSGCPVDMAPGNVIQSVSYDEDANNVNMLVGAVNNTDDKGRHADKVTLLFQMPEYRHLLKDMVKAEASLTLCYEAGGLAVELSPEEVAAIESKPLLSGRERAAISLVNGAEMLSAMCPMEWGDGSVLENVELDAADKQLSVYILAEKTGSPEYQTKLFKSELKAHRRDMALVHDLVKDLAAAGYGITVCYLGQDKVTIESEIEIPASDIYNISQLR